MGYKVVKLEKHRSSQCHVVLFDNGDISFYSYSTLVISAVCNKEENCYFLSCTGTYSQTTRRQISWFLKEYFPQLRYYHMRDIAATDSFIWVKCNKP